MARNDIWCELCEDKMKETAVFAPGRGRIEICGHCASMCEYPAIAEEGAHGTAE